MDDFERLFIRDCREKARNSRGAANRVGGSKSKKCTLPCDGMTQRQINAMSGPVVTYKLTVPLSDDEYEELPEDLKKMYRAKLKEVGE